MILRHSLTFVNPGPWSLPNIDEPYSARRLWVVDADGGLVAEVSEDVNKENRKACARLIAAAPELREALVEILASETLADADLTDRARAAIAKAEGRYL